METQEIKVFGHRSPDTDATASALVWSWFLNTHRGQTSTPYVLGDINTEANFVLESWGLTTPAVLEEVHPHDMVAIVDTNNLDELFENINETTIVSIIDHHKLSGNLKTNIPLELVIQPYASTMTVMYNVMNIEPEDFPREIAGLMLSGIISDTLEFRSPTTTNEDKVLAEKLAKVLDINISEYAQKMFAAKSDISEFSANELLHMDSKIFDIKGKNMRISVLETTDPQPVLDRYNEIVAAIPDLVEKEDIENVILFVIDIFKEEATVFIHSDEIKIIVEQAFNISITDTAVVIPGIVSRKKQILPALLQ